MPKTVKILPKWRNFAKSGHTGSVILKRSSKIFCDIIKFNNLIILKRFFQSLLRKKFKIN